MNLRNPLESMTETEIVNNVSTLFVALDNNSDSQLRREVDGSFECMILPCRDDSKPLKLYINPEKTEQYLALIDEHIDSFKYIFFFVTIW